MNSKKQTVGEINISPVPSGFADVVKSSGLSISIYYENITSRNISKRHQIRKFPYYCITHLIDGDGFYVDSQDAPVTELIPGDGIIVTPGKEMNYGALHEKYTEDAICFAGPDADALKNSGIVSDGVISIGRERRLLSIINKLRDISITSQFEANLMLLQLLIDLHRENNRPPASGSGRRLKLLLNELHKDPGKWWTVEEMANYCNISTNYLRRLFLSQTKMSPKEYIDRLKMTKASELLSGTNYKIIEIASFLGYSDQYHFSRRFTALCGMSPNKYRKTFSLHP